MRSLFISCFILISLQTHSQNGWTVLNSTTTLDLLRVQCYSDDTVFAFGDDGILLISYDGNTFTTKQNGTAAIYTAGFFKSADSGFVGNGGGNIMRTDNGGNSWSFSSGCTCFIKDISFCNSATGLYSGLTGMFRTTNAGFSWTDTVIPQFSPSRIIAVNDSVFIANNHSIIYKSTDGGMHFTADTIYSISSFPLVGLTFYDSQNGYVVSADGNLYVTHDQGNSWTFVLATSITAIVDMEFLDDQHGYMIAGNLRDKIYKTTNGGLNWTIDYTSTSAMEDISHSGNSVYICGQHGIMLKNDSNFISVNEVRKVDFSIGPNPAQDLINIAGKNITGSKYKIIDISGITRMNGVVNDSKSIYVSSVITWHLLSSNFKL